MGNDEIVSGAIAGHSRSLIGARVKGAWRRYAWLLALICGAACASALDAVEVSPHTKDHSYAIVSEKSSATDAIDYNDNNTAENVGDRERNPFTVVGMGAEFEGFLELYDYNDEGATGSSFMEIANTPEDAPTSEPAHTEAPASAPPSASPPASAPTPAPESKTSSKSLISFRRKTAANSEPAAAPSSNPFGFIGSLFKSSFKPAKKYKFRDVNMELVDTHLDLLDPSGVIQGRFTMSDEDSHTMSILTALKQRKFTKCDVKWVPAPKGSQNGMGHIQFECKTKVPAVGYAGQIPIAVYVSGLSKNKQQKIYIHTDGLNFRRDFEDIDHVRYAILQALGIDLDHQITITEVNGNRYKDDAATYQAIAKLVESGGTVIKVTVKPMIRLEANVQEPYSPTSENFNHELGNMTIDDYVKTLKNRKRLSQLAHDSLGENADGFTLVGINELHEGSKGFNGKNPAKMPIEIDEKLTFMPDVTVRFNYLDSFVSSKSFAVHTPAIDVVNVGRDIVRKARGGKDKNVYRVYAYSLPGCPMEEPDLYELMKVRKNLTIEQLPFGEACSNRRTHTIDFFYLNSKPANYIFDVDLTNPDGTRTETKRITVKYVDDSDMSVLKDAIVREFEKDGYLITPDDLRFVNIVRTDGGDLTDKTKISSLADIPKEQMLGHTSHITLQADPHLIGYFTENDGKRDTFEIKLPTTRPSAADIRNAFENELHVRNFLRPDENLHTKLRFHPLDGKRKVLMNMFVNPDEQGHFPAGTKLRGMAAEADARYEFPIRFTSDDGKVHKFSVHVPYGASQQQIEDLIASEIERRKYGDRPREMFIRMKGHDDGGLDGLWDNKVSDGMEFDVEPARLIDIGGVIDDIPTHFSMKIHPHEGRDEFERAIRHNLMHEPQLEVKFRNEPNHINDISTMVINERGNPYSDEDFAAHDLYNDVRKVRVGVSDHPLTLTWRDPVSGKDTTFCFSRSAAGACRGVPVHILAKLTFQQLSEILRNAIRSDNRELYEELVALPRKDAHLTSAMKMSGVTLVGGQHVPTPDVDLSDSAAIIEHLYGLKMSHIGSFVFSLMNKDELQRQQGRLNGGPRNIRLSMHKHGADPESHVVMADDMGPSELRNVINKYFRGVDDGSQIEGLTINGEEYKGQPLSYFLNKASDKNMPLKLDFNVANDRKRGAVPSIMNVRIQPKYDETLRSYFDRAMEEPNDFGLSPLHSYSVECVDATGKRLHVDGILDRPLTSLGMCSELKIHPKSQGRARDGGRLYDMEPEQNMEVHTSIILDENKDSPSSLNRQLRNFLMELPDDDLKHVSILIDDKPVKCSLSALREAYMIRNLTVDMLLSMCNMDSRHAKPSVFKINWEAPKEGEESNGNVKTRMSVNADGTPLCYFTLHKGQHDVGVGSTIPITLGTLKSPLKEFNAKLASMFGGTLSHVGNLRMSVVRNGLLSPCKSEGWLKNLEEFKKATLQAVFKMCGIPVAIPEDNTFYHFRLTIPFGEDMTYTSGVSMGGSVPVEMLYKDDDEFSAVHYNEDLRVPLYDYLEKQPDVDMGNLDRYVLKVRGENPGNETIGRTYKLNHLPSDMTLSSVFPHTPMNNIVFEIEDTGDPYNSAGSWSTGMSYPVNDYKNNFDAIKQQMIVNLKSMHGNSLSKLNGYNVMVKINGQKHECRIKSLADLERMDFEEFSRNCVNVEHVQNNPSMNFNVSYESGRGDPEINLSCICGDYDTMQAFHLKPGDVIPKSVIDQLTKKYTPKQLENAQWGIMINGVQGNCHVDNIAAPIYLSEILENCGVDDTHSRHFDITLHDFAVDQEFVKKVANENLAANGPNGSAQGGAGKGGSAQSVVVSGGAGQGGAGKGGSVKGSVVQGGAAQGGNGSEGGVMNVTMKGGEAEGDYSPLLSFQDHTLRPPKEFANVHPNVFVNMPQDYNGPQVNVDGRKSINDYVREIVMDENDVQPGVPINIRVNTNGHQYNLNDIPMDDLNYPSGYINGNTSINVRPDSSGSLPGTIRTFQLPETDKPLSSYMNLLHKRIPDMENKRLMLVGNKTMLDEDRIPVHLMNKPMSELRKEGYMVSLVNDPHDLHPSGAVKVNILSKDGFSSSATINDLQEPLRDVFAKIGASNVDMNALSGAQFKVVIDGIEKTCNLPKLDRLLTSVSMQDILYTCGIRDFNHSHDFTLFFDSLLGGETGDHRTPFKLEVDLDNNVDSTKNVDYSTGVELSGGALDFLKSKPNSHIFFDMEGKGFREFVEVDTEKFRQLLKAHPSVVDLLLRMGIPQEHLGGVDCLKIILSTLSQVLQGHQQYAVNNGKDQSGFNLDDPISKYQSIADVASILKERPEQDVTVSVELANGNTKDFVVSNREFLHALHGGLSFKTVALWGLSQQEADQITRIHFNTAPFGGAPDQLPEEALNVQGAANKEAEKAAPPASRGGSVSAGVITPDTMLRSVGIISKAMDEQDRNVKFAVRTQAGETFDIVVKGSMLKDNSKHGPKIKDLLSYFLPEKTMSTIASVSVQLVTDTSRFFVPLKTHKPVVMPIMAADLPEDCDIQEFKNSWNPPETTYRRLTLKEAIDNYRSHFRVKGDMVAKAAYLLRKEPGNNISAEVLFDEDHPSDDSTLNRKIGKDVDSGSTIFVRFKSSGELAP
ncbi:CAF1 ribonuclease domain containing protein, putative [Babesia ovata]|uniref:CAF1 ribonuclease domain containing protein, putative n=1 Tax=Babesia ovata TaxID=189622 RepID=A0A2H6KF79_9APIC|nr:CAF1 ribonuclease domain containing protein, putative [Babesia ovata]GBE61619.1 CAF1 ribonuclease domain containing protein, putative [Babesia ovata]